MPKFKVNKYRIKEGFTIERKCTRTKAAAFIYLYFFLLRSWELDYNSGNNRLFDMCAANGGGF